MDRDEKKRQKIEEAAVRVGAVFDLAKKQSDLVGMFLRLSAVIFMLLFVISMTAAQDSIFFKVMAVMAGGLISAFALSFYINMWRLVWWIAFRGFNDLVHLRIPRLSSPDNATPVVVRRGFLALLLDFQVIGATLTTLLIMFSVLFVSVGAAALAIKALP